MRENMKPSNAGQVTQNVVVVGVGVVEVGVGQIWLWTHQCETSGMDGGREGRRRRHRNRTSSGQLVCKPILSQVLTRPPTTQFVLSAFQNLALSVNTPP